MRSDEILGWTLLMICIILLLMVIVEFGFQKCVETEDMCFKKEWICGKTCVGFEKPTSCDDSKVTGHKEFCARREWLWNID